MLAAADGLFLLAQTMIKCFNCSFGLFHFWNGWLVNKDIFRIVELTTNQFWSQKDQAWSCQPWSSRHWSPSVAKVFGQNYHACVWHPYVWIISNSVHHFGLECLKILDNVNLSNTGQCGYCLKGLTSHPHWHVIPLLTVMTNHH